MVFIEIINLWRLKWQNEKSINENEKWTNPKIAITITGKLSGFGKKKSGYSVYLEQWFTVYIDFEVNNIRIIAASTLNDATNSVRWQFIGTIC